MWEYLYLSLLKEMEEREKYKNREIEKRVFWHLAIFTKIGVISSSIQLEILQQTRDPRRLRL